MTPRDPEALRVAFLVLDLLEELGSRHQLGGSYASSIHGVPRQTHDVDIVAELEPGHADILAERLSASFYLDVEAARTAIEHGRSFNLIHLESGVKIDLFPKRDRRFDELELARSVLVELGSPPRPTAVKSAEDTVLRKLEWFRLGGEVSDRQWTDVLAVLRTQGGRIDLSYLRSQAAELGLADLLASVLEETAD